MYLRMALRWILLCAGLWMLLALASGQLSPEQEQQIVDLHNQYRAEVKPEAADMKHMTWGEELSLVAKTYAAKCIWNHNPELQNSMGENLFVSTGAFDVNKAVIDWFEEHKHFIYDNNTCSEDEMCGHYTQVVWAKTTRVGCAAHLCETLEGIDFKKVTLLVCNYLPPGNVDGQKPYMAGTPCSQCPEDMMTCVNSLCAAEATVEPTLLTWTEINDNDTFEESTPERRNATGHKPFDDKTNEDIFGSVEPTELSVTESFSTEEVVGAVSERCPSALLLLTGLLACLLWM